MTNCADMLKAFELGGDFHSRTAISMYPYVKEAVDRGGVLLEWDNSQGAPPAPLLKEKFAPERKKAKVMNFSIAYGKTSHGFSKDFNCSLEEAKKSLNDWYELRQEVRQWQEEVKREA